MDNLLSVSRAFKTTTTTTTTSSAGIHQRLSADNTATLSAPCNLLVPIEMKRSAPNLSGGRHSTGSIFRNTRQSRSFTSSGGSGHPSVDGDSNSSPGALTPPVDTKQVMFNLLRKKTSTTLSVASLGDTVKVLDLESSTSPRPHSAEGAQEQLLLRFNTRLVMPSGEQRAFGIESIAEQHNNALHKSPSLPDVRPASIPSCFSKMATQVLEFLFISGLEAAYNSNLLCRLRIEYLVDLSNLEPHEVPKDKKSDVPCLCPLETPHWRAVMAVNIEKKSPLAYFDDINAFIDKAHTQSKHVLLFGVDQKVPCLFVAAYLMKSGQLDPTAAERILKAGNFQLNLSQEQRILLQKWDLKLKEEALKSKEGQVIRKAAWQ